LDAQYIAKEILQKSITGTGLDSSKYAWQMSHLPVLI